MLSCWHSKHVFEPGNIAHYQCTLKNTRWAKFPIFHYGMPEHHMVLAWKTEAIIIRQTPPQLQFSIWQHPPKPVSLHQHKYANGASDFRPVVRTATAEAQLLIHPMLKQERIQYILAHVDAKEMLNRSIWRIVWYTQVWVYVLSKYQFSKQSSLATTNDKMKSGSSIWFLGTTTKTPITTTTISENT